MSLLPQRQAPATRRLLRAEVVRNERTSEHFVTITLGEPELAGFPPPGRDQSGARQLIAADESGVPAALAVLESAPADLVVTVFLEVPAKSDVREVGAPSGVDVQWLVRENGARPGQPALAELTHAALPAPDYAWIAGESGLVTGARRFLNRERGVPKSAIAFVGYWRRGWSAPG
ncbi:NADPH-dependent ferric siderophore reductase [Amycolatopsis bartoniae]|uniref:SIP-like Rossmann fold domain-containing protein n=1 Tax=Amycolatopsis bartoniae TaxID=941986 RepID=A0A8H9IW68_9PSEU|nr:siderophore-interacting protein [Amycolatopsis bartoniae]MBB2936462.1 NADPH-dependent ferric siderophore reductase [Amycolatopsis bartoniae]TVT11053.1 siderophore-interacting protein [Amycolatopsis bartoniae]GHF68770.1 hypothetical protein GCM10017566_48280 [Amycolatopsis bartoniae]